MQTPRRGWLTALRCRDFRLLLIGEVTSATEMFYVALSWQMYLLTHSALALGLLVGVQLSVVAGGVATIAFVGIMALLVFLTIKKWLILEKSEAACLDKNASTGLCTNRSPVMPLERRE